MGWGGQGGEPARPSRALGCPAPQLPSHSSPAPQAAWGGASAPRTVPRGPRAGLLQIHGSPGVVEGREWEPSLVGQG